MYTDAYPATCQAAVDQNCCAAETACGADPGCTAYVTCANACPFPHTDGCLNDCQKTPGVTAEGLVKLNDLASCGKKSPAPEGGASAKCDWPK